MLANEGHSDWITTVVLLARAAGAIVNKRANISMTQYRILLRLAMSSGSRTVTALAQDLDLSAPTVTAAINDLESRKAVARRYSTDDRRVVHVELRPAGQALIDKADPSIQELAHDFWSVYSAEELELTFKDSTNTAITHRLVYQKDGELSVEHAYVDASLVMMNALAKHMRRANISLNEYRILYLLSVQPDGMRPSDICNSLLLRSNEVAIAAKKLEEHRRVCRQRDATDRRVNLLQITPEGLSKLERMTPSIVGTFRTDICELDEGAFDHYDVISRKLLALNRNRRLMDY